MYPLDKPMFDGVRFSNYQTDMKRRRKHHIRLIALLCIVSTPPSLAAAPLPRSTPIAAPLKAGHMTGRVVHGSGESAEHGKADITFYPDGSARLVLTLSSNVVTQTFKPSGTSEPCNCTNSSMTGETSRPELCGGMLPWFFPFQQLATPGRFGISLTTTDESTGKSFSLTRRQSRFASPPGKFPPANQLALGADGYLATYEFHIRTDSNRDLWSTASTAYANYVLWEGVPLPRTIVESIQGQVVFTISIDTIEEAQ